jgi:hypothetical protein
MEKIQTAVEWLKEQYYESEGKLTRHDFEEAKQMEKEQIINSYKQGQIDSTPIRETDAEQYFNLIFNPKLVNNGKYTSEN